MAFIKRAAFPQELTDMIIDSLRDDKTSLTKTALVAGSWLPRSQMHLFRRICVRGCDAEQTFARLAEFLRKAPHLGKHIHHLVLQGRLHDLQPTPDSPPQSYPSLTPRLLAAILGRLPSLKSFQLHEVSFHGGMLPVPFEFAAMKLQELIIMNAGSARDTTADLDNVLSLFSEVEVLHLSSISQDTEPDDNEEDEGKVNGGGGGEDGDEGDSALARNLRVSALKLEDVACDVYLEVLQNTESVKTLRSIEITCAMVEDASALSALLRQAGPNIEHLAVDLSQYLQIGYYPGEDSDDIDVPDPRAMYKALEPGLTACTGLTSLNVGVSFSPPEDDGAAYHHIAWEGLIGVLSSAPATVRRITIEFSTEEWPVSLTDLNVDWSIMQTAWKRFKMLECATFTTAPGCEWSHSADDRSFLRGEFEDLWQRNALRVEE